jgi:RNA polymerase sigma-70 factor (ECF subfamily)
VAGAEDALGEALLAALTAWPRDGVPGQPAAWLLTAARHRLIDQGRRRRVRTEHVDTIRRLTEGTVGPPAGADGFPDRRVELLFVCAHPAIDPALHTPLMLQTVLGLDATRIAQAFLVPPATMGQRLVRAKRKIREAGIPFQVPEAHELPHRLDAVLEAIYAAYGLGRDETAGADARRQDLADEAIWLARVVRMRMPEEPEVRGLLALMLFCDARRAARRAPDGRYVPLSEQSPATWSTASIAEASSRPPSSRSTPSARAAVAPTGTPSSCSTSTSSASPRRSAPGWRRPPRCPRRAGPPRRWRCSTPWTAPPSLRTSPTGPCAPTCSGISAG